MDGEAELVLAHTYRVAIDDAVEWLLDYPPKTVRCYDQGGLDRPISQVDGVNVWTHPGPPGVGELGRLALLNSVPRSAQTTALLLTHLSDNPEPWSELSQGASLVTDRGAPGAQDYERALSIYGSLTSITGVGLAIASKLMHIKFPAFVPVLDSCIRSLYRSAGLRGDLWEAIRSDLLISENHQALQDVREGIQSEADEESRSTRWRLAQLSDLRLFDMLCWGAAIEANLCTSSVKGLVTSTV